MTATRRTVERGSGCSFSAEPDLRLLSHTMHPIASRGATDSSSIGSVFAHGPRSSVPAIPTAFAWDARAGGCLHVRAQADAT